MIGCQCAAEPATEIAKRDHPGESGPAKGKIRAADLHLPDDDLTVGRDAIGIAVTGMVVDVLAVPCRRRTVRIVEVTHERCAEWTNASRHRPVRREISYAKGNLRIAALPEVSGLPGGLPPAVAAGDHRAVVSDSRTSARYRDHSLCGGPPVAARVTSGILEVPDDDRAVERCGTRVAAATCGLTEKLIAAAERPPKPLVDLTEWPVAKASVPDDDLAITGNASGLRAALPRLDHHAWHLAQRLKTGLLRTCHRAGGARHLRDRNQSG